MVKTHQSFTVSRRQFEFLNENQNIVRAVKIKYPINVYTTIK